jgi:serine/threonine protein phosphatase PrpC
MSIVMNKNSYHITVDYHSDSNSIRPGHDENQDSWFASESDLVFAVADGVGGYKGGLDASRIATDVIKKKSTNLNSQDAIRSCIIDIDRKIKERGRELHYFEMGTTVALASVNFDTNEILTGNVGDSPIFLVSKEKATPLYKDDSLRFEQPENMWSINQYLGFQGELEVHTMNSKFSSGDILLLCSDGVSDNLFGTSDDTSHLVNDKTTARELVELAMRRRIKADDMTAVLV